jgi:hypothetical protein
MGVFNELDIALQEYAEHLKSTYNYEGSSGNYTVEFDIGTKYIKVISCSYNSKSSHSFIVLKPDAKFKFGDILKSASWKAPAKNFARGNVLEGTFKQHRWCGI